MRALGLLLVAALAAGLALWLYDGAAPAQPADPPLALPAEGGRLTLVQRHDGEVPGSQGRLRVHLGDITRGQVEVTLSHRDGRMLIPSTSVKEGRSLGFSVGGRRYSLTVARLENKLIGNDSALLEFTEGTSERERIEQLLKAVEDSGLTFIRNGKEYDGADAAAHLRRKWKRAGDRIRTAEQFIEHVASRSSTTGSAYQLRFEDGSVVDTGVWLTEQLKG